MRMSGTLAGLNSAAAAGHQLSCRPVSGDDGQQDQDPLKSPPSTRIDGQGKVWLLFPAPPSSGRWKETTSHSTAALRLLMGPTDEGLLISKCTIGYACFKCGTVEQTLGRTYFYSNYMK